MNSHEKIHLRDVAMEFQTPPILFHQDRPFAKNKIPAMQCRPEWDDFPTKKTSRTAMFDFFGKKIPLALTNEGINHHQDHVKLHSLMNPAKGQPEDSVVLCGFKSKWSKKMKKMPVWERVHT